MHIERIIHNLALIGFMGAGKSSIGRVVAGLLHFEFLDTDEMIEVRTGAKIAQIFAQSGEAVFREQERQVAAELEGRRGVVIAAGGGFAVNPDNLASLKRHALVVYLWTKPETIFERVRHQDHRPLLQVPDALGRIKEMLALREPFYRQADVMVSGEMRTMRETAQHVAHQFRAAAGKNHE